MHIHIEKTRLAWRHDVSRHLREGRREKRKGGGDSIGIGRTTVAFYCSISR